MENKQYKNKKWLEKKYLGEKLSMPKIAELCKVTSQNINYFMKKFGISRRSNGEGQHISRTKHCNPSLEAIEWINGELLGDGCLRMKTSFSARFKYASKYLEYIRYVSDTLKSYGIEQVGTIEKVRYDKKTNSFSYNYCSRSYPELLPIYKKWYPEGKKIVPKDVELTPLVLRQHYIGDGDLRHRKAFTRPSIRLSTYSFPIFDVERLVKKLNKLGLKSTREKASNIINISAYSTKEFLDYIGKCPVKCYEYKWAY